MIILKCGYCGSDVADGSKYCNICGKQLGSDDKLQMLRNRLEMVKNCFRDEGFSGDINIITRVVNESLNSIDNGLKNCKNIEYCNELKHLKKDFEKYYIELRKYRGNIKSDKVKRDNNGSIISKIFIVLGALGVIGAGAAFFYINWSLIPDVLKGIIVAVIGVVVTVVGCASAIKNNDRFHQSIVGTGVALIYISIGMSLELHTVYNGTTDKSLTIALIYAVVIGVLNAVIPFIGCWVKDDKISVIDNVLSVTNSVVISICVLNIQREFIATQVTVAMCLLGLTYTLLSLVGSKWSKYCDISVIVGITMFTMIGIVQESGYMQLIWLAEVVAVLMLGYLRDKASYLIMAGSIFMITFFTHYDCELAQWEFWKHYGNLVTEVMSLGIVGLITYIVSKGKQSIGSKFLEIVLCASIIYTIYVYVDFNNTINGALKEVYESMRNNYSIDITSITSITACACFMLIEAMQVNMLKQSKAKIFNILSLIIFINLMFVACVVVFFISVDLIEPWSYVKNVSALSYVMSTVFLMLLVMSVLLCEHIIIQLIGMLRVRGQVSERVKSLVFAVTTLVIIATCFNTIYNTKTEVYASLIVVATGALMVYKGVKTEFKAMRCTGISLSSVFIVNSLFRIGELSNNIKPLAYLIIALSCFCIGWSYMRMAKQTKEG